MRVVRDSKRIRSVTGRRDGGAAAVEMALLLPLLLLVLFGLVDFGRAFNAQMQVTQAAREGVRVKALFGTDADASNRVAKATGGLSAPLPAITASTPCAAGDTVNDAKVTVSYQFHFLTPLGPVARLIGASSLPGVGDVKTLSSQGVMRCAG